MMTTQSSNKPKNQSRRDLLTSGAAVMGSSLLPLGVQNAQAQPGSNKLPQVDAPAGYNILFILVDQEHFFDKWPIPVPAI
jgi:hypothetical protein